MVLNRQYWEAASAYPNYVFEATNGTVCVLNAGTTGVPFDGVCHTVDLNGNLRRLCNKLMENLDSQVYFHLWVKGWKQKLRFWQEREARDAFDCCGEVSGRSAQDSASTHPDVLFSPSCRSAS